MTNSNKKAGQSTREMAQKRRKKSIQFLIFALIIAVAIYLFSTNKEAMGAIGGIGVLIMLVAIKVIPNILVDQSKKQDKLERRAIRGAVGEEKIGDLLDELGEDFFVINDVNSQFGNIDHVLIGKYCGILLIETKSHGGKVTVENETLLLNGHLPEKDFIKQPLNNTYWLRDQLTPIIGTKPWITSVIVFTNAFVSVYKPIKGITITNKKFLKQWVEKKSLPGPSYLHYWEKRFEIREKLES